MGNVIKCLDHGYVELIDSMGSDLRIVNAAQASFDKTSQTFGDRERRILRALMREEHGVPFEHVVFTFRLKLPIFLARQFVKHRVASWSEQSGRYDELGGDFYLPREADVRTQVGKPMDYTFAKAAEMVAEEYVSRLSSVSEAAHREYKEWIEQGIAREQARLFLPVNFYTNVVWTVNLRSLTNFLHLRVDSHAQQEAQDYALAVRDLMDDTVPEFMSAFDELGRPKL